MCDTCVNKGETAVTVKVQEAEVVMVDELKCMGPTIQLQQCTIEMKKRVQVAWRG